MRLSFRIFGILILFSSGAMGCLGEEQTKERTPIGEVIGGVDLRFEQNIVSFSSGCSDFENFYKNEMIKKIRLEAYYSIYYARRLADNYNKERIVYGTSSSGPSSPSPSAESNADSSGAGSSPQEHSDTNTQEAGVDEADIVKTNGEYLYVVNRNKVRIVNVSNPSQPNQVSSIQIGNENIKNIYLYKMSLLFLLFRVIEIIMIITTKTVKNPQNTAVKYISMMFLILQIQS